MELLFLNKEEITYRSWQIFQYSQNISLQNISLSVNDLLACCGFLCGSGCDGGVPISAWQYFVRSGVVTEEVSLLLVS